MHRTTIFVFILAIGSSCGEKPKSRLGDANSQSSESWTFGPLIYIDTDLVKSPKTRKTYKNGSSTPDVTTYEYSKEGDWKVRKTTALNPDGSPAEQWVSKTRTSESDDVKTVEEINTISSGESSQSLERTEYNAFNQIILRKFTSGSYSTEERNTYDQDQRLIKIDWIETSGTNESSTVTTFDYAKGELLNIWSYKNPDVPLQQSWSKKVCGTMTYVLGQPFCDPKAGIKNYSKDTNDADFAIQSEETCTREQSFYNCRLKTQNQEMLSKRTYVAFKSKATRDVIIDHLSTSVTENIFGSVAYTTNTETAFNPKWMTKTQLRKSNEPNHQYECTLERSYDETNLNILTDAETCSGAESYKTIYEY